VFTVAQALGVLEHLVGDARDGHGLVQILGHVEHEAQVALHVAQRLLWIEVALGHFWKEIRHRTRSKFGLKTIL